MGKDDEARLYRCPWNLSQKQQEIMLPVKTLKKLGIDNPKRGMKIALDISISFFRQKKKSSNYQAGTVLIQKIMEEAKQSDMCQKRN